MRWAGFALALVLVGCARPPEVKAYPALWRVADGDTTIWLFGSIHALPPDVDWRTPAVARAIAASDTLILEVPPADPGDAHAQFLALANGRGLPALLDRVAPTDRGTVARGMAVAGQSPETLDGLKAWAAALTISAGAAHLEDADPARGVETVLTGAFAGKAIGALESREGQFRMFDRLPAASQRLLLVQAAREALDAAGGYATLLRAWERGDEAGLAADVAPLLRDPAIAAALVEDRNARWTSAIVQRLTRPGHVFVTVGAGHLVGPRSVVTMLRALGVRVERVE
jgi:uncharacterized protein YbaP (TraB family)